MADDGEYEESSADVDTEGDGEQETEGESEDLAWLKAAKPKIYDNPSIGILVFSAITGILAQNSMK